MTRFSETCIFKLTYLTQIDTNKEIKHPKFTLRLLKDNVLYLKIHENQTIEVDDLPALYGGYDVIYPEGDYVVMMYGSPFASISKEARDIAASEYASERRKKIAFISTNIANIMIVRFFCTFYRPKTQIQIFRNEIDALAWLQKDLVAI